MNKLGWVALVVGGIAPASTLDVYVYDRAGVPEAVLAEAHDTLARILRVSGIHLRWLPGSASTPEAGRVVFPEPARPGKEHELTCAARRDVALLIIGQEPVAPTPNSLGFANPLAPEGVNATILYGRVNQLGSEHGVGIGTLLGHAIAHEIGHVLLRSNGHRKHGLMAGSWDKAQFQWIRRAGMFFDKDDAQRMKASISGQGCSNRAALTAVRP